MNAIESGLVQLYEPCAGGCGEPILGGAMCVACARLADHYEALECAARAKKIYERRRTAPRGMFTFLGWNSAVPATAARLQCAPAAVRADAARLGVESEAAPACGDPARRSALMAKLPRVPAGVAEMHGLSRWELWQSDVPLGTVLAIVICDAARWAWCWVMDALGCFVSRRLRGRLGLTAMVVGIALGAGASWLAAALRVSR